MNAWCLRNIALAFALASLFALGSLWPQAGHGAPANVEAFDAGTWGNLQAAQKLPTVVVFSTTDCVHCPAVIEELAQNLRRRKLKASVIAVVMDAAPGESDAQLLAEPHYRKADRLFAFAGQASGLRYGIDPRWRGVTPFIALLKPGVPVRFVTGAPSAGQVEAWIGASTAPPNLR